MQVYLFSTPGIIAVTSFHSWSIVAMPDLCWIHCDANRPHSPAHPEASSLRISWACLYTFTYGFVFKKHGVEISLVEGAS